MLANAARGRVIQPQSAVAITTICAATSTLKRLVDFSVIGWFTIVTLTSAFFISRSSGQFGAPDTLRGGIEECAIAKLRRYPTSFPACYTRSSQLTKARPAHRFIELRELSDAGTNRCLTNYSITEAMNDRVMATELTIEFNVNSRSSSEQPAIDRINARCRVATLCDPLTASNRMPCGMYAAFA